MKESEAKPKECFEVWPLRDQKEFSPGTSMAIAIMIKQTLSIKMLTRFLLFFDVTTFVY